MFQETGSHCLWICDWFAHHRRGGQSHPGRSPLDKTDGAQPVASCTYNHKHACWHTRTCIQTHSFPMELEAGASPKVIKTRLLWWHRHHTNTNVPHIHARTHMRTCLFPLCSLSAHQHIRQVGPLLLVHRKKQNSRKEILKDKKADTCMWQQTDGVSNPI